MKTLVGAFNQKALVGTFSVITNLCVDLRLKLYSIPCSSEARVAVQLGLPQRLDALAVVLGENVPPQLGGGVRGRGAPVISYRDVFLLRRQKSKKIVHLGG